MTRELERLFYAKNIAVIGATSKKHWGWSNGNAWISGSFKMGFQGAIYPVHPRAKTILGIRAYPSVLDIPGEIDLAVFTVPLAVVSHVMDECVRKGVKFVHLLTAGFSETGEHKNADIEKNLIEKATRGGIRVIGPNCMGIYCPEGGLSWSNEFSPEPGTTGLFSQSGQLAYQIVTRGGDQGLRYSKVVSFGNASDLQAHDFLRYFALDDKTKTIGAYLEGLRDGRSFFKAAKETSLKKPLVVWKGGQTEGGSRATLSHTSAMSGAQQIWNAMCRQTGIIMVHSMDEMIYTIKALQSLPKPKGTNVAILGGAGGGSVTMTDFAEKEGLRVPHLTDETIRRLAEFVPLEGNSAKNPLDINPAILPTRSNEGNLLRVVELLRDDRNIDAMIFSVFPKRICDMYGKTALNAFLRLCLEATERLEKPLFISLPREDNWQMDILRRETEEWFHDAGVATFPDFRLAARVMRNMKEYGDYLSVEEPRSKQREMRSL
ncbi:MAG: CoA-binding protein [Pseudomonadota bacterium]